MIPRLLFPAEAGAKLAGLVEKKWAAAVCAEANGEPYSWQVSLRPNVTSGAIVERHLLDSWGDWRAEWRRVSMPTEAVTGPWVESPVLSVRGQPVEAPKVLHVPGLKAAEAALEVLHGGTVKSDLARARDIAHRLQAGGSFLTPAILRKVVVLAETDLVSLFRVLEWLADHPDVSRWSARQLPVPHVDTKWLDTFMTLVCGLTGRDLAAELRRRPTAVHLTYVDPAYLARPRRRQHDSWTAGDQHDPAYLPSTVLVVENRDCRVFFPELPDTVVVEGGGAGAAALSSESR